MKHFNLFYILKSQTVSASPLSGCLLKLNVYSLMVIVVQSTTGFFISDLENKIIHLRDKSYEKRKSQFCYDKIKQAGLRTASKKSWFPLGPCGSSFTTNTVLYSHKCTFLFLKPHWQMTVLCFLLEETSAKTAKHK